MKKLLMALVVFLATGCSLSGPAPQKGGSASVSPSTPRISEIKAPSVDSGGMPTATLAQSENPNSSSSQAVSYENEEVVEVPVDTVKETTTTYPDGRSVTVREPLPAGTRIVKKSKSNVNQELGGSWKDTARELGAALSSFQGVQYVGIGIFLFGSVAFFNVGLRALIGGKDAAMAVGGAGLVMMFGPFIFVKYSKWFFLAILGAAVYWGIARFKYQHGRLDAIESGQQK